MKNVKAFVVGVSNYIFNNGNNNLPFCKNDIKAVNNALIEGLKVESENILILGTLGEVIKSSFEYNFEEFCKGVKEDDNLIFYFSGHGLNREDKHYLVLSDTFIETSKIINILENVKCKNKIIFLDCCYSGNFNINHNLDFDVRKTVSEFEGKGYAILASSNSKQVSYSHPEFCGDPETSISLFTYFLCEAIKDKYLIKEGKITLKSIVDRVFFSLDIWNRNNDDIIQNPIFRSNIGGTIFFEVEEFEPFISENIYEETDKYIIYEVEPVHTGTEKRYSTRVILKGMNSFEKIGEIASEIKEKVKSAEIYSNEFSKKRWSNKTANIIWIYFGMDESDIINSNFLCHTTWVDESQDKDWWYKTNNKNNFIIDDIHFNVHSYYDELKSFTKNNTSSKEELEIKLKEIMRNMVICAEKVIVNYNEYKNQEISEDELFEKIGELIPEIDKNYFISINLGIAPEEIHDWAQKCSNLFSTIHDFTFFYNKEYKEQRSIRNRKDCMEIAIKRYYSDLNILSSLEKNIQNICINR
ncbi:caspase family protein [Clostridium perfringens]|nr:caspase family protein [Clostridium perfringens]